MQYAIIDTEAGAPVLVDILDGRNEWDAIDEFFADCEEMAENNDYTVNITRRHTDERRPAVARFYRGDGGNRSLAFSRWLTWTGN